MEFYCHYSVQQYLALTKIKTKKKHFCAECGEKFQNKRKLKHHFQTIHELKQKVEIHESKEHIENIVKDFNCDICSLSFTKESRFKEHADSVHGDKKPFKCSICPKSLSGNQKLQEHIESVHEKKTRYECSSCDSKFYWKELLQKHIRTVHEKKKLFKCEICDKSFSKKETVKTHTDNVHNRNKQFKCDACDSFFSKIGALNRHKTNDHGVTKKTNESEWICKICEKVIPNGKNKHIQQYHCDSNGLKCPKCDKQFSKYILGWFAIVLLPVYPKKITHLRENTVG